MKEEARTIDTAYDRIGGYYEALLEGTAARRTAEVSGLLFKILPRTVLDGRYLVNVVDLCCGTGHVPARLSAAGGTGGPWWFVTGVDASVGQLRYAADRLDRIVLADAAETGLPTGSTDLVTCLYATTDVPDWSALVAEAARLLVPGGYFAVVAAHPCFAGPDAIRNPSGSATQVADRYLRTRHTKHGAGFTPGGLREQVGAWQRSLSTILTPLTEPAWRLVKIDEAAGDPPDLLGLLAQRV